jgi:hypothetical protein
MFLSACVGVYFVAAVVSAEDLKPPSPLPNLSKSLHSVRFYVGGGRIQAVASEAGVEQETSTDQGMSRREKLVLNTNDALDASIQYELSGGDEHLAVDVVDGQQFTVARRPAKDSKGPSIEFRQPQTGPLTLTVNDRDTVREVNAESLWHLIIAEPELSRRYLLPLLEMFRPDWRLLETAQAVEAQMLRTAAEYHPENLRAWDRLVAELGSDRFAERQHAENELRTAGSVVIPYLASLERRRLDFEQWSRVRQIVESADGDDEDRAEGIANRLMPDRRVWLMLLDRSSESGRRVAAGQLSFLLGSPIAFDPAGTDEVRRGQLLKLRQRVERDGHKQSNDLNTSPKR